MRKRIIKRISIKAVSAAADHIIIHIRIYFCRMFSIGDRNDSIPVSVHQQDRFCIIPDFAVNIIIPHVSSIRSSRIDPVEIESIRYFIKRIKLLMNSIMDQQRRITKDQPVHIICASCSRYRRSRTSLAFTKQDDLIRINEIPLLRGGNDRLNIRCFCDQRHLRCLPIAMAPASASEVKTIRSQTMRCLQLRVFHTGCIAAAKSVGADNKTTTASLKSIARWASIEKREQGQKPLLFQIRSIV